MARKQAAKKKVAKKKVTKRPDKPGRFIPGYGRNEESFEQVALSITEAMLTKIAAELKELGALAHEKTEAMNELKAQLKPVVSRQRFLIASLASGTVEERREVFLFADDKKNEVALYDVKTHELLTTRALEDWERQESMDFDEDAENEPKEAEPEEAEA